MIGNQVASIDKFSEICVKIDLNPEDVDDDYEKWNQELTYDADENDQEMSTSKPIIYLKHTGFYFNVTKEMSFENLIFDARETFSKISHTNTITV